MLRALQCPSSGAHQTAVAASGFRMNVEVEVFSAVVPRLRTLPCWAVSVRQSNKILRLIVASSWVFYLSDWRYTEPQTLNPFSVVRSMFFALRLVPGKDFSVVFQCCGNFLLFIFFFFAVLEHYYQIFMLYTVDFQECCWINNCWSFVCNISTYSWKDWRNLRNILWYSVLRMRF